MNGTRCPTRSEDASWNVSGLVSWFIDQGEYVEDEGFWVWGSLSFLGLRKHLKIVDLSVEALKGFRQLAERAGGSPAGENPRLHPR